ncbi:MAG: hypothetical protein ACI9ON_003375, partial [Limisphaerales bacterium]
GTVSESRTCKGSSKKEILQTFGLNVALACNRILFKYTVFRFAKPF